MKCLVSGSSDKSIICWTYDTSKGEYKEACTLYKHTAPITILSSLNISGDKKRSNAVIGSCGADSLLIIWKQSIDQTNLGKYSKA